MRSCGSELSQGRHGPPVRVKSRHKNEGRHWQQLIFHVSCPPPEHAGCHGDACGFLTSNGIVICIFPQDDHEKNTCSLFPRGPPPCPPVKTSHKKDGGHWWPLIFHVLCPCPPLLRPCWISS